jgi:hypothetical protein
LSSVTRIECPHCSAQCIEQESNCWQCGLLLKPVAEKPMNETGSNDVEIKAGLIRFGDDPEPESPAPVVVEALPPPTPTAPGKPRVRMTMSGEEVEEEEPETSTPILNLDSNQQVAASIGVSQIIAEPGQEVMVLSFCKNCGYQNEEGLLECARCKHVLEIVAVGSIKDIEPLPRAWGFDVLGAIWIILGMAAIYCGQFLIKADPKHPGNSMSDYLWTGIVVCAPGILIFMRHYFCKVMFWVMTLGSIMVWSVIGFLWVIGKLLVTDNMQVGLTWLAILSALSVFSFFTVRVNDAFDYGM